jgi:hypothetical protein
MMTADTPMRSRVRTKNEKCSVCPPVSQSNIMGFVVTSIISSMVRMRLVISTSSMSGLPLAVESHKLDTHIASNWLIEPLFDRYLEFSTIRPVSPLCASIAVTSGFRSINFLSRPRLISGIERWFLACCSSFCNDGLLL